MIINSSTVAMTSEHSYSHYEQNRSVTVNERASDAIEFDLSEDGKGLMQQLEEHNREKGNIAARLTESMQTGLVEVNSQTGSSLKTFEAQEPEQMALLRKLMEAIRAMNGKKTGQYENRLAKLRAERYTSAAFSVTQAGVSNLQTQRANASSGVAGTGSNLWTRTTVTSSFVSEMEHTAFQTAGIARTADGREISFGVTVEMSRAFCAKYESFTQQDYVMTDPLVINIGTDTARLTDKKFLFDLDADGKEEEISFAGEGSGFLALDKNGDGKINDGSELFGTKSGDGFADLAKYDRDGNGWIDEADDIWNSLRIWTKDEDGNDYLIDLKSAGVGAIYLGNAGTEFSLNNPDDNSVNGMIRKTGIYLKENGGVGTVQHVDLAV